MKIALFLLISFAWSWTVFGLFHQSGGLEGQSALAMPIMFVAMLGPALGAILCTLVFDRARWGTALGFSGFGRSRVLIWIVLAWVMAIVLVAGSIALTGGLAPGGFQDPVASFVAQLQALAPDEPLPMDPALLLALQLGLGLPIGIAANTVLLTISEELGWRGWLQPRLMGLGFWPMCLVTGVIWGLWHAPIILMGYNFPGLGVGGVGAMIVFTVMTTPYVALAAERGGVWAAGAFHGAINALAGLSVLFLASTDWPWNGLLGIGGFGVMAVGLPLIWLYRRAKPLSMRA
ncbi:CPBP family intramembrane glutamic endopeptidase [Woodsholea maritima]|uniref:CPBP family intramembrane glutamic endopeptidase n=1 Tax=Woodsholea maritima TaxID=240237 RepID=UPI00035C1015|nr:CPBP family intramembrane glutamic endopeptidase [Woodsholea maritima]